MTIYAYFFSFFLCAASIIVNYHMAIRKNFSQLAIIIWSILGFAFPMVSTFILMGVRENDIE